MKAMKRIIVLFFTSVLITLSACGNGSTEDATSNIEETISYWSVSEVESAMYVVRTHFETEDGFKRWKMNEIRYGHYEDDWCRTCPENIIEQKRIIIKTDIQSPLFTSGSGCMSGCTYSWILEKTDDTWQVISYGQP